MINIASNVNVITFQVLILVSITFLSGLSQSLNQWRNLAIHLLYTTFIIIFYHKKLQQTILNLKLQKNKLTPTIPKLSSMIRKPGTRL